MTWYENCTASILLVLLHGLTHRTIIKQLFVNQPEKNAYIATFNPNPSQEDILQAPAGEDILKNYSGEVFQEKELSPDFTAFQEKWLTIQTITPAGKGSHPHIYAVDTIKKRILAKKVPAFLSDEKIPHFYLYSFDKNHTIAEKEIQNITYKGYNFPEKAWLTQQNTILAFHKHRTQKHSAILSCTDIDSGKNTLSLVLNAHDLLENFVTAKAIKNNDPLYFAMEKSKKNDNKSSFY